MSAKSKKQDVKGEDIQVELGNFTRIHHAILEKLALVKISGYEFSCLMVLFRETYGYSQKDGAISLNKWQEDTGIERRNLTRTLNHLVEKKIIYKIDGRAGRTNASIWGFNKYTDQWKVEQRQPIMNEEKVSPHTPFNEVSPHTPFSDEKVSPHTPPKNPEKVYPSTPEKVYSDTPQYRKKERTTTTTERGGSGGSFETLADPQEDALRCWRDNMEVPLTPIIVADLKACIDGHGASNVMEAIAVAVRANNHTMRYVKGVLNRRGSAVNGTGGHTREVLTRIGGNND